MARPLVDARLVATGVHLSHEIHIDRVLDSPDQERERGILVKAATVMWKRSGINLVDTPGHGDFGWRARPGTLANVDGILALVDAAEGSSSDTLCAVEGSRSPPPGELVLNNVDRFDVRANRCEVPVIVLVAPRGDVRFL